MRDLSNLRSKKVLVTGHTGFKGGWLTSMLIHLGAEPVGYSLEPPSTPSFFGETGLDGHCRSIHGDVRDLDHLVNVMEREEPEVVFHLAAQPLVLRSYQEPIETFDVNVMGTANLLEAVRSTGSVKACVCVTSDKCYENMEWGYAYRENDPLGGSDPYSASKGAAEIVVASYRRSFLSNGRCGLASVRAGNVIGGGDWAENRILPDCVRSLAKGERIGVRNPGAVRPWQHVLEPLYGYLLLSARLLDDPKAFEGAWNFGPMVNHLTVGQLVDTVIQAWGSGGWDDLSKADAVHEARYLRLDSTKANVDLGWIPRYDVKQSVLRTVEWYRKHHSGADMMDYTLQQIADYLHAP